MDKVLLDTDIFSELLRARNSAVLARAEDYLDEHEHLTIGVVTVVDIVKGLLRADRPDALAKAIERIDLLEVLPLDQDATVLAGEIYGDLERTGKTIGRMDPMIAGIALWHDLPIATGNTAHYKRASRHWATTCD